MVKTTINISESTYKRSSKYLSRNMGIQKLSKVIEDLVSKNVKNSNARDILKYIEHLEKENKLIELDIDPVEARKEDWKSDTKE